MASYSDWLDGLTCYFFGPPFRGRRVRLIVTREMLDEHFGYLGGTVSFLNAMRKGPDWSFPHADRSMHALGLGLFRQWSEGSEALPRRLEQLRGVPTYLPYLCLLCLAWTEEAEAEVADHAYFKRLTALFPDHRLANQLRDWNVLWDGLAQWTAQLGGEWGVFIVEKLGGMPYVGIPKSQVIFTPRRIERMRDLFHALGLGPGATISESALTAMLCTNDAISRQCIGEHLVGEIAKGSALGQGALKLLIEHLNDWDGAVTIPTRRSNGTSPGPTGPSVAATPVSLVLEAVGDSGWALRFGIENDPDCEALKFDELRWQFRMVQPPLALAYNEGGSLVDAGSYLSGQTTNFQGKWRDGENPLPPPRYEFRPRRVWFFDRWTSSDRLIECRSPTNAAGVYMLADQRADREWREWFQSRKSVVTATDYTMSGLPEGFSLRWIVGLDKVDRSDVEKMPGSGGGGLQARRFVWISGGTRVREGSARGVYAAYDPPVVNFQGPRDLKVVAEGAQLSLVSEGGAPRGMPGEALRTYALAIKDGVSAVVISVRTGLSEPVHDVAFAIDNGGIRVNAAAEPPMLFVDRFGDLDAAPGVHGATTPSRSSKWDFEELRGDDPGEPIDASSYSSGALQLLDSLSTVRRLTIQEYAQRALRIAGAERWSLFTHTRWLHSLGHIELQLDDRGRWSYVYPVRRQAYLLPWLNAERFQAAVIGCGPVEHLRKALATAERAGCKVAITRSGTKLLPPRILILHRSKEKILSALQSGGIAWTGHVAADALADWSCSLHEWLQCPTIRWHPQPAPPGLSEYIPATFRMSATEKNSAPSRLFWMLDPYSQRHYWHVLQRQPKITEMDRQVVHAFLRDAAWAKWKAHLAIADDEDTLVPYCVDERAIPVPRELHLPFLLARALCFCSGLPPKAVRFSLAYADSKIGVLPTESPRYGGECWQYSGIPRGIAEKVARKLSGRIKQI